MIMQRPPNASGSRWRGFVVGHWLGAMLLWPTLARAQTPDDRKAAEALIVEAERAYEAGDYPSSLDGLTQAQQRYGSPLLFFNFGLTYRGLGRDRDALAAFERFLAETSADDTALTARRKEAAWHIEALHARLSPPEPVPVPPAPPPVVPIPALATRTMTALSAPSVAPPMILTAPAATLPARTGPLPLYRRWWFWTAVGAVAAGAVTTAILWPRNDGPCSADSCSLGRARISPVGQ